MNLNKYFKRHEFACKCNCGFSTVDAELLEVLTVVRKYFKAPVRVNSGCRCMEYNEAVQLRSDKNYTPYSSSSKHMEGIAADITVDGYTPPDVYAFLCRYAPSKYGIGKYNGFTHIDVRQNKARW